MGRGGEKRENKTEGEILQSFIVVLRTLSGENQKHGTPRRVLLIDTLGVKENKPLTLKEKKTTHSFGAKE